MSIINGFNNIPNNIAGAIDRYNKLQVNLTDTDIIKTQTYNLLSNMKEKSNTLLENEYVIVSCPSVYSTYYFTKAFDGNADTYYESTSAPYNIVDLVFKKPVKLTKVKLSANSSATLQKISIKGSIDGTQYIELYTTTTYPNTNAEITLQNTDFYKYYCLETLFSGTSAGYFTIYNFEVTEWVGSLFEETCELNAPLNSYEENKIVNIELNTNKITEAKYRIVQEFTSNIIPVLSRRYADTDYGIWECFAGYDTKNAYKAFDMDNGTYWAGSSTPTETYSISIHSVEKSASKSKFAIKPRKIVIRSCGHDAASLMGRRANDKTFVKLGDVPEVKNNVTVETVLTINTDEYFDHFYIDMGGYTASYYAKVYNFEITEGTLAEGIFEEQIQKNYENLKININNLGFKTIQGLLQPNEKYNLIYNGENWDYVKPYKIVKGTYTGTGSAYNTLAYQTINLGKTPNAVLVFSNSYKFSMLAIKDLGTMGSNYVNGTSNSVGDLAYQSSQGDLSIVEGGFSVGGKGSNAAYCGMNNNKISYEYIAIF